MKLGGFGMPLCGLDWVPEGGASSEQIAAHWGDDIRWLIELFGVDRCMFESNFPADNRMSNYREPVERIQADRR